MAVLMCSNCLATTQTSEKNLGKVAKCPKCGEPGKVVADPRAAEPDAECSTLKKVANTQSSTHSGRIVLTSGTEINFSSIYMFSTDLIQEIEQLRQSAIQKMTPRSSGIGFIGDIGYVLAASAAAGAVDTLFNSASQKSGDLLMQQYYRRRLELRYKGKFRALHTIQQIQFADPGLWVSLEEPEKSDDIVVMNDKTPPVKPASYILADDPFICFCQNNGKPISVRWELVEQFWVSIS